MQSEFKWIQCKALWLSWRALQNIKPFFIIIVRNIVKSRMTRMRIRSFFIRVSFLVLSLPDRLHPLPWQSASWPRFPSRWWSTTAIEPSPLCALWRTYGPPSSPLWPRRQRSEESAPFWDRAAADWKEGRNYTSQTDACYGIFGQGL